MDGANTNALEWALALLHTPAERYTLRQKPLPQGIDRLLGIAAGVMPRDQVEAARAFGVPEARVREAAQFYAREVLFFPQADAYRVLGVNAVASSDQIKAHHRLLQHWLHPDRQRSEDDAIFAARVNSAWNLVRTPGRRQAYDASLQSQPSPEVCNGNTENCRAIFSKESIIAWHFKSFRKKKAAMKAWAARPDGAPILLLTHPRELDRALHALASPRIDL